MGFFGGIESRIWVRRGNLITKSISIGGGFLTPPQSCFISLDAEAGIRNDDSLRGGGDFSPAAVMFYLVRR